MVSGEELRDAVKNADRAINDLRFRFGKFCEERKIHIKEVTGCDLSNTPIGLVMKYSKILSKASTPNISWENENDTPEVPR